MKLLNFKFIIMKKNYFFLALFMLAATVGYAQPSEIDIDDNMESYTVGDQVLNDWWQEWTGSGATNGIFSSDVQAQDGTQSGWCGNDPAADDAVLGLGGKIFDVWHTTFWLYISGGAEGYMNIQGNDPVNGAGEWVVGNIFMNQDTASPGVGLIDNCVGAPVNFDFPHDQWFEVVMIVDISGGISAATWSLDVDGVSVIAAGTPFTDAAGTIPTSLGGINFYAISANMDMYVDNVWHANGEEPTASVNDFASKGFSAYPNPVNDKLNIEANEKINTVVIYNVLGQQVYNTSVDALSSTIDMSNMASGAYFVSVNVNGAESTVKVIK